MMSAPSPANSSPVRPKPVAISSSTSNSPYSSQSSRSSATHSGGWKRIPPAPCTIGSTITPASSCAWRANSSRTSKAHSSSQRGSGAKTCSTSVPVNIECIPPTGSQTAIAPNVSPW